MEAFIDIDPSSDFSSDNLPYGVYTSAKRGRDTRRICVALGDRVVDLAELQRAGLFSGPVLSKCPDAFQQVRACSSRCARACTDEAGAGSGPRTGRQSAVCECDRAFSCQWLRLASSPRMQCDGLIRAA